MEKSIIGNVDLNFNLPNAINGEYFSLETFNGARVLVVVFTCNHCPYAVAYEDRLIQLQKDFAQHQVQLIAISSNDAVQYPQDSFDRMKERAQTKGFNFPYLYDADQSVARNYGAERTPHIYVMGKDINGWRVIYQGTIDDNANYKEPKPVTRKFAEEAIWKGLEGDMKGIPDTVPVGCSIKWKMK